MTLSDLHRVKPLMIARKLCLYGLVLSFAINTQAKLKNRIVLESLDPNAQVSFSPDESLIAITTFEDTTNSKKGTCQIWEAKTRKFKRTITHVYSGGAYKFSAIFFPDNERLMTTFDFEEVSEFHRAEPSPGKTMVWDLNAPSDEPLYTIESGDMLTPISFSPDGTQFVTGSYWSIKVWDAEKGTAIHTLEHEDIVQKESFSPRGDRIVTASLDGTAKIWDAQTGGLLHTLSHSTDERGTDEESKNEVDAALFFQNGDRIATLTGGAVWIWDANTGTKLRIYPHHARLLHFAFSPLYDRFVTVASDCRSRIWSTLNANENPIFVLHHPNLWAYDAYFSHNGRFVLVKNQRFFEIWDSKTGKRMHKIFRPNDNSFSHAFFSRDEEHLITIDGGEIKIWDLYSPEQKSMEGLYASCLRSWNQNSYYRYISNEKRIQLLSSDLMRRITEMIY